MSSWKAAAGFFVLTFPSLLPAGGPEILGAGACSQRGCHGSLEPVPGERCRQNEYTTWLTNDRHAGAFRLLLSPRSRAIAENLRKIDRRDRVVPTAEDARCLACHALPARAALEPPLTAVLSEGVGCEACHGPAGKWLALHNTARWRELPRERKLGEFAMHETEDLAARARLCAGCHVGAPPDAEAGTALRDANHAIMVAGHPRLRFDFGSFHANLPRHWREKGGDPLFEARAWAVGQVVAAIQALKLLEHRSRAPLAAWPELAEYDCYACHHDLGAPGARNTSWRQDPAYYAGRKPGSLPWGEWYFGLVRVLALSGSRPSPRIADAVDRLAGEMAAPSPDRDRAAGQAAALARLLEEELLPEIQDPKAFNAAVAGVLRRSVIEAARGEPRSWDQAAQLYLAVFALQPEGAVDVLQAMEPARRALQFDAAGSYESPRDFRPATFRESFGRVEGGAGAASRP